MATLPDAAITSMTAAPGDPDHLYFTTRNGAVQRIHLATNTVDPLPLTVMYDVDTEGDGALQGLAFHPDFATNGKFYVSVAVDNGGLSIDTLLSPFSVHVREYTLPSGSTSVSGSEFRDVLRWVKPTAYHNGGDIAFSPLDGYLYIGTGDGGNEYDTGLGHTPLVGNARDLTDNLMGKILRIDVDADDFADDATRNYGIPATNPYVDLEGDDEIYAYGLRNPWRISFDRANGDLWIADVGESVREEIDLLPAHTGGGQDFGWSRREGSIQSPGDVRPAPDAIDPVYDYAHMHVPGDPLFKGNSVVGGYRYRGPDPTLQGMYFFADFSSRQIWYFNPDDPAGAYASVQNVSSLLQPDAGGPLFYITTFGEDLLGNLYLGTGTGSIYRIATNDLIPGDFNGDGNVDAEDRHIWGDDYGTTALEGDADGSGYVDGADFVVWQRHLGWDVLGLSAPEGANRVVPEPIGGAGLAAIAAVMLGCPGRRGRSGRTA